jgi:hypothetical protein
MTTLVTPYFRHERVIGDRNGIFGDKSDLSQKIFSLVVFRRNLRLEENPGPPYGPEQNHLYSGKPGPRIGKRARRVPS